MASEDIISKIEDTISKSNKSHENFQVLETKLKTIISKCTKNTLIETDNNLVIGYLGVENANQLEHYALEDNIHVYKMFHDNQPIDYFISDGPLEESYQFTNAYGTVCTTKKYTAVPFIEYTVGGQRNCLATDHINHYPLCTSISAVVPSSNRTYPECDLTCASGFRTDSYFLSTLGNSDYRHQENMGEYLENGDFCSYIRNIKPKAEDRELVAYLQKTLDKIDKLSLIKTSEKKGFLKGLLGKNKELAIELEPFQASKKR